MFTTGLMGIPGLWIFSWAFNVGGVGSFVSGLRIGFCGRLSSIVSTFFDVCLVFTRWVQGGGFKVVLGKEVSYFLVVFLFMYDDHGFAFICLCDYCVVFV